MTNSLMHNAARQCFHFKVQRSWDHEDLRHGRPTLSPSNEVTWSLHRLSMHTDGAAILQGIQTLCRQRLCLVPDAAAPDHPCQVVSAGWNGAVPKCDTSDLEHQKKC